MKPIVLLVALACPLQAELIAAFQTTRGEVLATLQFDKAPKTVANFITLAQGTRARVDPLTGTVTHSPLYIGEKFFRVINDPGFKIAQTGSGTGNNSGGPGFTFRDEFDPTLTHVPYVLSMANSGPNTNGSQIFFTGNATISGLDHVHTIFGLVTDPSSRSVIDAILAAGNDATTIGNVTFSRTDAAALAFDEHAQLLPVCSGLAGMLSVSPGVASTYILKAPQTPGSVLQAFRSPDLSVWSKLGEIYQGTGLSGAESITLDTASLPRAFYQIPLVTYPDALAPASLADRTLVTGLFDSQTITFHFDSTGTGGTATYSNTPDQPITITDVSYQPSPYKATWIISTDTFNPLRFRGTLETETDSFVIGSNTSDEWTGFYWSALSSGTLSLSK